ncbi:MAG: (Fe-S)-binding protein [Deltaproteobacteria bacterium]|nr:(Fe-S)-binding protein [Deltaproteobacteria bacterium]
MYELKYDPEVCAACETIDCLMKCQYLDFDLDTAKQEKLRVIAGEDSVVLTECATCYACEEYCPNGNHPFYLIVERQEEKGFWPVPRPLTNQQLIVMGPRGRISSEPITAPVLNMCAFTMLMGSIRGRLFEGVSSIVGNDIFCNAMWLHYGKNSAIRERLPQMIENIWEYYLKDSDTDEMICFHDECYGTYTQLAEAFGIDVPFKPVYLFEYLVQRLDALKGRITPLEVKVAYQRPCSNRLIPETQHWVDDIFERIGVDRVEREYDRENALCCGGPIQAQQRDELADDVQQRNIDDMKAVGAEYCVFNCPACFFTLGDLTAERGITPILMNALCLMALGE